MCANRITILDYSTKNVLLHGVVVSSVHIHENPEYKTQQVVSIKSNGFGLLSLVLITPSISVAIPVYQTNGDGKVDDKYGIICDEYLECMYSGYIPDKRIIEYAVLYLLRSIRDRRDRHLPVYMSGRNLDILELPSKTKEALVGAIDPTKRHTNHTQFFSDLQKASLRALLEGFLLEGLYNAKQFFERVPHDSNKNK